jgi:hypothetical protein
MLMKLRRFGLPSRKEGKRKEEQRRKRVILPIQQESRKPCLSGRPSSSPIRLGLPLLVAPLSQKRDQRRNSRSSLSKLSISHSLITQQEDSCGRTSSIPLRVTSELTSHSALWLISLLVILLVRSKRLVKRS